MPMVLHMVQHGATVISSIRDTVGGEVRRQSVDGRVQGVVALPHRNGVFSTLAHIEVSTMNHRNSKYRTVMVISIAKSLTIVTILRACPVNAPKMHGFVRLRAKDDM